MAIYTRFGTRVNLVSASLLVVWIEELPGEIKWHLREPKPSKKAKQVTEMPVWFATAVSIDDREGHGPKGRFICDGKGVCINDFRADDGHVEIGRRCEELSLEDGDKFNQWIHGPDKLKASDLFPVAIPEAVIY